MTHVVNLPPPVDVLVGFFVLRERESRAHVQTVVDADAVVVIVIAVVLQVVVVVVAALHRDVRPGDDRADAVVMPAAALQILVIFVVQRERPVQVELALQIVRLPLQIRQNAIHLLQHLVVDPVGRSGRRQLLPRVARRRRVRVVRADRDVVDLVRVGVQVVQIVQMVVHQRDAAVVGRGVGGTGSAATTVAVQGFLRVG